MISPMVQALESESETDSDDGQVSPKQRGMPTTKERNAGEDFHLPEIKGHQPAQRKSIPTKPEVAERIRSAQQLIKAHPLKQATSS